MIVCTGWDRPEECTYTSKSTRSRCWRQREIYREGCIQGEMYQECEIWGGGVDVDGYLYIHIYPHSSFIGMFISISMLKLCVCCFRFVCKDTVEEKILQLQKSKMQLANNVLTGYVCINNLIKVNVS